MLVIAAVVLLLALGIANGWYTQERTNAAGTGARKIDPERIQRLIDSGDLSAHDALFQRPAENGNDRRR